MEPAVRRSNRAFESLSGSSIMIAIVIAGLYYGRAVLIPFALALLLSLVLTHPVAWLERTKMGRGPAVMLVLAFTFSGLGGLVWLGGTQLADIVSMVPKYQSNIHNKIQAMRGPAGSALGKAQDNITELIEEFSGSTDASSPENHLVSGTNKRTFSMPTRRQQLPVPVEMVRHQPGVIESLGLVGMSIVHFAELAGGVLIFTLLLLMQRSDLRNRLFRLMGQGHLNVMTTALDDATNRVSKYLLTQSIVNGTFGLLLALGLYWIGVPNAPFWGVLAAVLRFVPYVGSSIAGLCPLVLALAVFEGWTGPLLTLGLFMTVELVASCLVEPWLYGAHTGLSSLAILISAAFWTLLWGPIGLILSTPLTVCLLVTGRYVPSLSSLAILLGDQPVLPPEACYYQRLLAGDEDEAQEIAESYLKDHTLVDFYDAVLIPALALAERDRHDRTLDEDRAEFIHQTVQTLIEELEGSAVQREQASGLLAQDPMPLSIVCLPARDRADELAGRMLKHIAQEMGHDVTVISTGRPDQMIEALNRSSPNIIFVSALPPLALSHARSLCRRIRREWGTANLVVSVWNSPAEKRKAEERWGQEMFDSVILSLNEAQTYIQLLREHRESPEDLSLRKTEALHGARPLSA
jgi:predicted PurR-regulated permease PerM